MICTADKQFINNVAIGFADELRLILTDFHGGLREMHEQQQDAWDLIASNVYDIVEQIRELRQELRDGSCQMRSL